MGVRGRKSGSARTRAVAAITVGGAAVVLAGCVTAQAVHPTDDVSPVAAPRAFAASAAGGSQSAAGPSTTVGTGSSAATGGTATPGQDRSMLVVGASYTAGLGAKKRTDGYAYQLGRKLGWRTDVVGIPGTGYVNEGPHGEGSFAYQIEHVHPPFRPDVVLIQGGRNDVGVPSAVLRQAVEHTVTVTRDRFGDPAIALLGPIPGRLPIDPRQRVVERVLDTVATQERVLFVDPLAEGWINPSNLPGFRGSVPGHPNDAGYAYIADRVAGDLKHWSQDKTA